MALQPFTNEQLNSFKFSFIVLNEIPKALRQAFKQNWNNTYASRPGFQSWDDSNAVRNLFLSTEGRASKVPTHLSYHEWDCTALFRATIYAQSFALPDSKGHRKILRDLYLTPTLPPGTFHSSVVSSTGDKAETFALAIDQLRLLRNSLCHSDKSEMDKIDYDRCVQLAKDAMKALGVNTDPIDAVGSLTESDFPTEKVRKLEDDVRKELQKRNEFLEEEVIDDLQLLQKSQKEGTEELKKTIQSASATSQCTIETKFAEFQTENRLVRDELHLLQESRKDDTENLKKAVAASEERVVKKINEFSQEMKDPLRELQSLELTSLISTTMTMDTSREWVLSGIMLGFCRTGNLTRSPSKSPVQRTASSIITTGSPKISGLNYPSLARMVRIKMPKASAMNDANNQPPGVKFMLIY